MTDRETQPVRWTHFLTEIREWRAAYARLRARVKDAADQASPGTSVASILSDALTIKSPEDS